MSFYLTGNPVPSASMPDVHDNAQNLDFALNEITSTFWTDRLGRRRMSWFGIESAFTMKLTDFESRFDSRLAEQESVFAESLVDKENRFQQFLGDSGYVFLGDYEDGPFQFSARNQYIRYDNQYYRLNAATDVGFTTTGTDAVSFASDVTHFVLMDGDTLRQNLGSSEEGLGASLVMTTKGMTVEGIIDNSRVVQVEQFEDINSAAGDWSTALQAALDYAAANGIPEVWGKGDYTISDSLLLKSTHSYLRLRLNKLSPTSTWAAPADILSATPLIKMGGSASQCVGFDIDIDEVDGLSVADMIQPVDYGFCYGRIRIRKAANYLIGIHMGSQTWPNSSVLVEGDDWGTGAYIGLLLQRGSTGTSPICEGWNINIRFNHAHRYAGVLLRDGSQYAKLFAGDIDYNGNWVSLVGVSSYTGVTRDSILTNGTTSALVLGYFYLLGVYYVLLGEAKNVTDASSFAVGDTLTSADGSFTTTVTSVRTTSETATDFRYFDIVHDFAGSAFGRITVLGGYSGGVVGGLLHSSDILIQNSFSGHTLSLRGLGISESGNTLALYRNYESRSAFANITADYVNFARRLYMGSRLYEGIPVYKSFASSATDFTTLYTFTDVTTDKYSTEGTMYEIALKGNYADAYAYFIVFLKGATLKVVRSDYDVDIWAYQVSGAALQLRQYAQDYIITVSNIRRI